MRRPGSAMHLKGLVLLVLCAGPARSQTQQELRVYFTKEVASDPAQSAPAVEFVAGDALYAVIAIVGEGPLTLGDLGSKVYHDGRKQWVWQMQLTLKVKGVPREEDLWFRLTLTEAEVQKTSYAIVIIPPVNDPARQGNMEGLLADLLASGSSAEVTGTLEYDPNRQFRTLPIHFDLSNPENRYRAYAALFQEAHRRAEAEARQAELSAEAKVPMPVDGLKDPALNRSLVALLQAELGTSVKVFRVIPRDRDWQYVRNQYGILTGRRLVDVWTAYQDLKSRECWLSRKWSVAEGLIAGDKFTKPTFLEDATGRKNRWAEPCAKIGGKN